MSFGALSKRQYTASVTDQFPKNTKAARLVKAGAAWGRQQPCHRARTTSVTVLSLGDWEVVRPTVSRIAGGSTLKNKEPAVAAAGLFKLSGQNTELICLHA
jgi:hypothetical protein